MFDKTVVRLKEVKMIAMFTSSLAAFLAGSFIYISFRSTTLRMFRWFDMFGISRLIEGIRHFTLAFIGNLPDWLVFSLPNGLWLFSYITLILYIWGNHISNKNIFWVALLPLIALFSEFGQLVNLIPGTYDAIDVVLYIVGLIMPILFFKSSIKFTRILA